MVVWAWWESKTKFPLHFNSLAPRRCNNFKCLIFKVITQNCSLVTHCEIALWRNFGLHTFLRQQIGLQVAYDKIVLTASILYNNHANSGLRGPLFIHERYRVSPAEAKIGLHILVRKIWPPLVVFCSPMISQWNTIADLPTFENCLVQYFLRRRTATWYICIAAQVFSLCGKCLFKKVFFFKFYIKH